MVSGYKETPLQSVKSAGEKRNDRLTTTLVSRFPDVTSYQTRVIFGAFSWTMPFLQTRLLDRQNSVNLFGFPQSPTEISRDYLKAVFPNRLRATGAQVEILKLPISHPLYAKPCIMDDAAYVDLKAAYWSILNSVGWDVDYFPNRWLAKGRTCEDFPIPKNKPARNALVSMGLPSSMRFWDGKTFKVENTANGQINLGIWKIVHDVLHAIAKEALSLNAVYVHTDGYILPFRNADELIRRIGEWGLKASIRAYGQAEIYGAGLYSIEDHRPEILPSRKMPHNYIENVNSQWLQRNFTRVKNFDTSFLVNLTQV